MCVCVCMSACVCVCLCTKTELLDFVLSHTCIHMDKSICYHKRSTLELTVNIYCND